MSQFWEKLSTNRETNEQTYIGEIIGHIQWNQYVQKREKITH